MFDDRYNCRTVTFAGSIFCALGIGLSGFATSILFLFLTFGVLTGIGVGLSTTPGALKFTTPFCSKRKLKFLLSPGPQGLGPFVEFHDMKNYYFE